VEDDCRGGTFGPQDVEYVGVGVAIVEGLKPYLMFPSTNRSATTTAL